MCFIPIKTGLIKSKVIVHVLVRFDHHFNKKGDPRDIEEQLLVTRLN